VECWRAWRWLAGWLLQERRCAAGRWQQCCAASPLLLLSPCPPPQGSKSFFSEIIASISDIRFSRDGRYILSRDYMNLKLWDMAMEGKPLVTLPVHEELRPRVSACAGWRPGRREAGAAAASQASQLGLTAPAARALTPACLTALLCAAVCCPPARRSPACTAV
jgi:hypothetical protein